MNPNDVLSRLEQLRSQYTPESVEDARARLAREIPASREPFERAVERRLDELRALCNLASHLHRDR